MATDVHVARVASYSDVEAIRSFVSVALNRTPDLLQPVRDAGPSCLVVVKPNWIQASHEYRDDVWEPVITHPAVILATLHALADAMGGVGTIALCDAPHTYADIEAIIARDGLKHDLAAFHKHWPKIALETLDLRREVWEVREQVVVARRPNPPDPRGYVRVDLGRNSLFYNHPGEGRYYGADYDQNVVNSHHCGETQEYLLSGTAMACDLFVNLPKLKTHKKTGITCCLKNLVGINGDKNWLPHHTEGSPRDHGDEFPGQSLAHAIERRLKRGARRWALQMPGVGPWVFRKMRNAGMKVLGDSETTIRNGNWHGNDTCWRMALDLTRSLLYGMPTGTLRTPPSRRRYLAIVDGIIGGQGNGPICPDPVAAQVLLSGTDPAAVDAVAARLMGFCPTALPLVHHAFDAHPYPIAWQPMDQIEVRDARVGSTVPLASVDPAVPGGFRPHFGWTVLETRG